MNKVGYEGMFYPTESESFKNWAKRLKIVMKNITSSYERKLDFVHFKNCIFENYETLNAEEKIKYIKKVF